MLMLGSHVASALVQPALSPPSLERIPEPVRQQQLLLCNEAWFSISVWDPGYFQLAPQVWARTLIILASFSGFVEVCPLGL